MAVFSKKKFSIKFKFFFGVFFQQVGGPSGSVTQGYDVAVILKPPGSCIILIKCGLK